MQHAVGQDHHANGAVADPAAQPLEQHSAKQVFERKELRPVGQLPGDQVGPAASGLFIKRVDALVNRLEGHDHHGDHNQPEQQRVDAQMAGESAGAQVGAVDDRAAAGLEPQRGQRHVAQEAKSHPVQQGEQFVERVIARRERHGAAARGQARAQILAQGVAEEVEEDPLIAAELGERQANAGHDQDADLEAARPGAAFDVVGRDGPVQPNQRPAQRRAPQPAQGAMAREPAAQPLQQVHQSSSSVGRTQYVLG